MTQGEIAATMRALVADRLALRESEVSLTSRLIDDLGADSLDFVDLLFTLERRFGIKLRDGQLDVLSQLDFSSPAVMRDGVLTRDAVERLREALPALDRFDPARITPAALFSLITVQTLCDLVERRLAR